MKTTSKVLYVVVVTAVGLLVLAGTLIVAAQVTIFAMEMIGWGGRQ